MRRAMYTRWLMGVLIALLMGGCSDHRESDGDAGSEDDTSGDSDGDSDSDSDGDGDADSDGDADGDGFCGVVEF